VRRLATFTLYDRGRTARISSPRLARGARCRILGGAPEVVVDFACSLAAANGVGIADEMLIEHVSDGGSL